MERSREGQGMLAGQVDHGDRSGEARAKARDLEAWAVPGDSSREAAFQTEVSALAQALTAGAAGSSQGGIDRALDVLVSGLGATAAAFYAPTPTPRPSGSDGLSKEGFTRRQSWPVDEPADGARVSRPPLPAELDLVRLPDQGEALLAGRARRVFWPQMAGLARTRGSIRPTGWESVPRLSHALLLVPCLGPEGLLGVFGVDGGLASQRGSGSVLTSATLLGTLVASFLERKRLETELASLRARRAQSERLETLGRVAASVAHDFNNVLTAIGGNAELLEMALPEDAKEQTEVREIVEASARAADLVEEVLSFGRGREEGVRRVSLAEVVSRLEAVTRRVAGNGIDVLVDIRADLPSIELNPGRFERVLLNLASNARDAQPENRPRPGVLALSARSVGVGGQSRAEDSNSTFARRVVSPPAELPAGQYLCLRVEDDGCGMDLSVQAQAFEPFFTTKGEGRGTGLGLATCAEIMRDLGGAVAVDSAPGDGTVFDLYFPVAH